MKPLTERQRDVLRYLIECLPFGPMPTTKQISIYFDDDSEVRAARDMWYLTRAGYIERDRDWRVTRVFRAPRSLVPERLRWLGVDHNVQRIVATTLKEDSLLAWEAEDIPVALLAAAAFLASTAGRLEIVDDE